MESSGSENKIKYSNQTPPTASLQQSVIRDETTATPRIRLSFDIPTRGLPSETEFRSIQHRHMRRRRYGHYRLQRHDGVVVL
jgi:hypothetical protein